MALETFSSNDLLNFIVNASTTIPPENSASSTLSSSLQNLGEASMTMQPNRSSEVATTGAKRKRIRIKKPRAGKSKEETETQRMTHILVERNRRKQMNGHLDVLRSLMPESYVQRNDQASIVGGAIEFVKELEHLLQNLETQKFQASNPSTKDKPIDVEHPFAQFFRHPRHNYGSTSNDGESSKSSYADNMEVTLNETHTCVRILSRKCHKRQFSKLVWGFHALGLSILHLNVTTMEPFVLYTISAKIEEGSRLTSVDAIVKGVHQVLAIIQAEPDLEDNGLACGIPLVSKFTSVTN